MLIGAGIVAVIVIGLLIWGTALAKGKSKAHVITLPTSAPTIEGIQCNQSEQLTYHQHAKLDVFVHGKLYVVPPFVGIPDTANCLYWLHTHPTYPQGVIHMEYPTLTPTPTPTLQRFLVIWSRTRRDQDKPVAEILRGGPNIHFYVNGRKYRGTLASIKLHPHERIAVEIGGPYVTPPKFNFAAYGL